MIRKAIVLAAGRGTRMGALTEDVPKPMLPVEGRPMIEHIVRRLQSAGLSEVLLVVGYRRDLIEDHFRGFGGVSFVTQHAMEGTARAALFGRGFAENEPFLLTFGDILTSASNYTGIREVQSRFDAAVVAGVKYVDDPWQGAAVYVDESGAVTRIVEKPAKGASATHWNSAGLYGFGGGMFEEIAAVPKSARGEYEITSAVEQAIAHGRPVRMFEMTGAWRDVGRPEDLRQAGEILRESAKS
ncbi:MAG: nucleotidyltransferase family protein [Acidobacteriota bacterium]|nr:nucleotidyltransferase family protein [Acidobacteriota bacterium]